MEAREGRRLSANLSEEQLAKIDTLLVGDYSSLEIGVQGDLALRLFGDDQIVKMYDAQAAGVDMHSNNARAVFGEWLKWTIPGHVMVADAKGKKRPVLCPYAGERVDRIPVGEFKKHPYGEILRQLIKAIWYGMAYGKGAYGFSTLIGADGKMIGEEVAGQMVNALLDAVPAMRRWFEWVEEFITAHFGIYSLGGRWCDLRDEIEAGEEWMFRRALRRAYNFPMQASGADIIGDAMRRVSNCRLLRALGFLICLQVHDELVLRGPKENVVEAESLLRMHMQSATANGTKLLVKLQVGTGSGDNYYDAK